MEAADKKFNKKDLELIFKDIFLNFEKKIILRNILDENYEYIRKLETYFELIKNNKNI